MGASLQRRCRAREPNYDPDLYIAALCGERNDYMFTCPPDRNGLLDSHKVPGLYRVDPPRIASVVDPQFHLSPESHFGNPSSPLLDAPFCEATAHRDMLD
jgi:hypothetical protein